MKQQVAPTQQLTMMQDEIKKLVTDMLQKQNEGIINHIGSIKNEIKDLKDKVVELSEISQSQMSV